MTTLAEDAGFAGERREALETQQALCAGWVDPSTQCTGQPTDNTCCALSGRPVMPRVWKGNPYPASNGAKPVSPSTMPCPAGAVHLKAAWIELPHYQNVTSKFSNVFNGLRRTWLSEPRATGAVPDVSQ